ncbi:MAG: hypothetical protein HKN43_05140 [Rhodothermales bacterium]|nr:hypothetical protein [Rhodothermales bacterium]
MGDRKVQFETSPEKYFGALLERVLRNEAHLQALTEHIARLLAALEQRSEGDIKEQLEASREKVFQELSAEVIAKLTQGSPDELLDSLK